DAHTLYVVRKHRDLADLYGDAPAAVDAAIEGFTKQLRFAERRLDDSAYLLGDVFTAADLLLTTCLTWANAYGVEISDVLQTYTDRITERDAFKRAAKLNFSISPGG
ncbi:MAG: glutathione S-transferase C-terminal domain-containing protein, partial [Pseudomonadales bacterium]